MMLRSAIVMLAVALLATVASGSRSMLQNRPTPICVTAGNAVLTITGPAANKSACQAYAAQLTSNATSFDDYYQSPPPPFYKDPGFVCTSCRAYSPNSRTCFATITANFIPINLYLWYFEYWAIGQSNGVYGTGGWVVQSHADPANPDSEDHLPADAHGYLGNACVPGAVTTYKDTCGGVAVKPYVCP